MTAGGGVSAPMLRWTGACAELTDADRRALFDRTSAIDTAVGERTASIVARVRREGDVALRALAHELDGVELDALEVPRAQWRAALDALPSALRTAIERSAENVRRVHRAFRPMAQETES